MSINQKLIVGLAFFVAGLAAVLITAEIAFKSLDVGFSEIVDSAETAVEASAVAASSATDAAGELERISAQVPTVAEDVQQTRLRVKILERKISGVANTLGELVETIESTCKSLPEGDAREELEWLADDAADLQETVRKEALVGLAGASETMAASAESLGVEIKAIKALGGTLAEAAARSGGALSSSEKIAGASEGFQSEIVTAESRILWILTAIALLAVVSMLAFMRFLGKSLQRANGIAEGITAGDLKQDIDIDRTDEIGALLHSMDEMQTSMRESLESIESAREEDRTKSRELESAHADQKRQSDALRRASEEAQAAADAKADEAEKEATMKRELEARVDQLLRVVEAVAQGDLQVTSDDQGDDAVGRIVSGIRELQGSLRRNFSVIAETAKRVSLSSSRLTQTSGGMYQRAEGTSSKASYVSGTSSEVSSAIESIAAASEEMAATANEIASQTAQVASIAHRAVDHSTSASQTMREMDAATCEIREIIQLITGIAEQTNLLALNATIEAARAGDSGKGFAVVANEVKDLAQKTASATGNIVQRISTVEAKSTAAVSAIETIAGVIREISDIQTSVAGAVEEQTATTGEITRSIVDAAEGSAEITKEVAALASASSEALTDADTSQASSEDLAQVATELKQLVSLYRI